MSAVTLCHACGLVFSGGWTESHDHAADAHRGQYLADPGSLLFTDVLADPSVLASACPPEPLSSPTRRPDPQETP